MQPKPQAQRRAVIYLRVSTDEQAEHGHGLTRQQRACDDYCARHGMTVTSTFSDDISGTVDIGDRPAGAKLMRAIDARECDAVVIEKADRIGRDVEGLNLAMLSRKCRLAGVSLHLTDRGELNVSDPWGTVSASMDARGAADYRAKLIKHSREGRRDKAAAGKWVGQGAEPFGYRRVGERKNTALAIDPEEAAIVRRIFALYVGTDGRPPMPARRIVELLTDEGVQTPARAKRSGKQNARGWHTRSLHMILTRRLYVGELVYPGLPAPVPMPGLAIVDRAVFDGAQDRLYRNRHLTPPTARNEYLLSQHVRCGCGRAMFGKNKREHYRYYTCAGQSLPKHLRTCSARQVNCGDLDALAWDWLRGVLTNENELAAALADRTKRQADQLAPKRDRLDQVKAECERLRRQIDTLTGQYADAIPDELQSLKGHVREKGRQLTTLEAEQAGIEAELKQGEFTQTQQATITGLVTRYRDRILNADAKTRRYIVELFDVQVRMHYTEAGERRARVSCGVAESDVMSVGHAYQDPSNHCAAHPTRIPLFEAELDMPYRK